MKSESRDSIPEHTFMHFAQDSILLHYNDTKDRSLSRVLSYICRHMLVYTIRGFKVSTVFLKKVRTIRKIRVHNVRTEGGIPESCRAKVLEVIHEPPWV